MLGTCNLNNPYCSDQGIWHTSLSDIDMTSITSLPATSIALHNFAKTAKLLAIFAAYAASSQLCAQTYTPIGTTGYNHDVIANGIGNAASSTSHGLDGVDYVLKSLDWKLTDTSLAQTSGLPLDGLIVSNRSPQQSYQLQSYAANNSLRLSSDNPNGTLELTDPSAYRALSILATSGSGSSSFSAVVHFSDDTQTTLPIQSVSDWFGGSNHVVSGMGRVSRYNNSVENSGTNPRLYQINMDLPCNDHNKVISKIEFTRTPSSGILNIFALSGTDENAGLVGQSDLFTEQSITLHAPLKGGSWSSDTPTVAIVDNTGKVSGIAAGQATITYTSPCGSQHTHMVTVANTMPTTTALSSTSAAAVLGSSITLTAVVTNSNSQGRVTFLSGADASTPVAGCTDRPIEQNQAECTVTLETIGHHRYVAKFSSSNPAIANSSSSSIGVDVLPASFLVTASPLPADAAAHGGSITCSPTNPVTTFTHAICTANPEPGYMLGSWAGDCSHSDSSSNTCTLSNVTADQTVSAQFIQVQTSFNGTTSPSDGTTAGTATVSFSGGGATCRFDAGNTAFVTAPQTLPQGQTMPHGMLDFKLIGCDTTPVTVTITWPDQVQGLTKWGKASADATSSSHFQPSNLLVNGRTTTFTVQDGQLGDDDWTINGEIVDPVGATVQAALPQAVPVPTMGHLTLALLSLFAAGLAALGLRKRSSPLSS